MSSVYPWGPIGWLLPKINVPEWHLITSTSFEDRAVAAATWMSTAGCRITGSSIFKISNPKSSSWELAQSKVENNLNLLLGILSHRKVDIISVNLLDSPKMAMDQLMGEISCDSCFLDITTLPKRFFLYAFKRLMEEPAVKNFVVTYGNALKYPEHALCADALPPSPIFGYGRTEDERESSRLLVGVGYVALSVDELLENAKKSKLDFLFPFPPASPAFRRNWSLLSMLMPEDRPKHTEIHRVHGMDAFEVFSRFKSWGMESDLNMLPLGPKPHALGMAMAYLRLDGKAELIYAQPKSYLPNYSEGIAQDEHGRPAIVGYCLKRNGKALF